MRRGLPETYLAFWPSRRRDLPGILAIMEEGPTWHSRHHGQGDLPDILAIMEEGPTWHSSHHGQGDLPGILAIMDGGTYLAFWPSWRRAAILVPLVPWWGLAAVAASTGGEGGGPAPFVAAAPSAACAAWSADPKSHVAVGGGWGHPLPPAPVHPELPPLSLARRFPGSHTHTQHSLRGPPHM